MVNPSSWENSRQTMSNDFDKLIFSFAYNMTGDYETSKDVVQDINLKLLETPIPDNITDIKNYIIRTTVNHCINNLKRQKKMQYAGTWLPEPFTSDNEKMPEQTKFERNNLLCYELAFLMEQLSSTERAVFVLREAFDFNHKDIAEALGVSTDNSRQLLKRAKEKVANRKHKTISNEQSLEIAKQFVNYISEGKLQDLIDLFNEDISIIGDGGGKVPSIVQTLFGKENVALFLLRIFGNRHFTPTFQLTNILSQPAIVVYNNSQCVFVQVLSLNDNKISQVFAVLNPDKLMAFKK
jgi:RNA polymerase sigma-70 factor (ECF subfamily)